MLRAVSGSLHRPSWNEDGLATLQLPADSTKSLVCFALTPNVNYEYNNLTGVAQPNARFTARAVITIENEVYRERSARRSDADRSEHRPAVRRSLGSGLTQTQAKQFFKKPMKFTFGSSGTVQLVDFASYFYGIRRVRRQQGQVVKDAHKKRPGEIRPALLFCESLPAVNEPGRDGTG